MCRPSPSLRLCHAGCGLHCHNPLWPSARHTANNIEGFLEQTKSHLGARRIGLLRADSGFLSPKVIDWCEKQQADFIIAAKMTQVIQRTIGQVHDWCDVTDGIAISEASYKASSWDKSYRVIFIRQDKDIREQAIGKSLSLFEDDWDFEHYRYSALVTNMKYDAATIWRVYRLRANCENQISTKGRFRIKQLCDEELLGHGSGINLGDVDSKPGQLVSQKLFTFDTDWKDK